MVELKIEYFWSINRYIMDIGITCTYQSITKRNCNSSVRNKRNIIRRNSLWIWMVIFLECWWGSASVCSEIGWWMAKERYRIFVGRFIGLSIHFFSYRANSRNREWMNPLYIIIQKSILDLLVQNLMAT